MSTAENSPHWSAPERAQPLRHSLSLPGSKSLTNRELVLAALAEGPSTLRRPLHSRDTALMVEALRSLGATITEIPGEGAFGSDLAITPIPAGRRFSVHRLRAGGNRDALCPAASSTGHRNTPVRW